MMDHFHQIAQLAAEYQLVAKLLEAGSAAAILCCVLAWFMLKSERKFDAIAKGLDRLGHKFHGLTKAILIDTMSRDTCGPTAKKLAQEMIADMEAREKVEPARR